MGNINSSVGVELELVVALQNGDGPRRIPRMFQQSRGRPIVFEGDPILNWLDLQGVHATRVVTEHINQALIGHQGDRVITSEAAMMADQNSWHLRNYASAWEVKRDASVYLDHFYIEEDPAMEDYTWVNLEITTPALRATDASYAEIHRVVSSLHEAFWVLAPHTAGMHVHYGRGIDWIPADHLRNIAALLYAADPILAQLHPYHRRNEESVYCRSNRLYCNLAHGMNVIDAEAFIEEEYQTIPPELEPQPIPGSVGPGVAREPRPTLERSEDFISIFPRGSLGGYSFSQDDFVATHHHFMEGRQRHPLSLYEGPLEILPAAQELLASRTAPTISFLMEYAWAGRLAYNFNSYTAMQYRQWVMAGTEVFPNHQYKRTIEFRQPAGTVDPDEVVAHAKVIVRLCEFASITTVEELWKTINDLDLGEKHNDWYDVFDLLIELNLDDEARVIQRQMARDRGIEILDERLGLVRELDPPQSHTSYLDSLFTTLGSWMGWTTPGPEQQPKQTVIKGGRRGQRAEAAYNDATNFNPDLLWIELGTEGPGFPL